MFYGVCVELFIFILVVKVRDTKASSGAYWNMYSISNVYPSVQLNNDECVHTHNEDKHGLPTLEQVYGNLDKHFHNCV